MKSTTPGIEIAMESWGSVNEGGAEFLKMGHEVTRIPSQCVKPFVRNNKTMPRRPGDLRGCTSTDPSERSGDDGSGPGSPEPPSESKRLIGFRTATTTSEAFSWNAQSWVGQSPKKVRGEAEGLVNDPEGRLSSSRRETHRLMSTEWTELASKLEGVDARIESLPTVTPSAGSS